jgi:plasmid maintenance system antidote protein VapI
VEEQLEPQILKSFDPTTQEWTGLNLQQSFTLSTKDRHAFNGLQTIHRTIGRHAVD